MHFLDSEDEAEEKVEAEPVKEETKVMTRSECEKANIAPPPASKAPTSVPRTAGIILNRRSLQVN